MGSGNNVFGSLAYLYNINNFNHSRLSLSHICNLVPDNKARFIIMQFMYPDVGYSHTTLNSSYLDQPRWVLRKEGFWLVKLYKLSTYMMVWQEYGTLILLNADEKPILQASGFLVLSSICNKQGNYSKLVQSAYYKQKYKPATQKSIKNLFLFLTFQ